MMGLVMSSKVINQIKDCKHIPINMLDITSIGIWCETNLFFWDIMQGAYLLGY